MRPKVVIPLFFLLISIICPAQESNSLKHQLTNASDTAKCRIYNLLVEGEQNDTIWPIYNSELIKFCENKLKTCPPEYRNYYSMYYALGLNNYGFMHMDLGNSVEAIEYYTKALKIQESIKDKRGSAATLVNIGYVFRRGGNISKAIENYHSALKMYTELKDTIGVGTCYNNIGFVFDGQGQFEKALEYYEKALDTYSKINNKEGMALCYGNIAYMYKTRGEPGCKENKEVCIKRGAVKAIRYLMRGIHIQKELNDKDVLAGSYNLLGGIYDHFGDPECAEIQSKCEAAAKQKALSYYNMALQLRLETNNAVGIATSYFSLADHMYRNNDQKKALDYALMDMKVSLKLNSPEHIGSAANLLKNIYRKMNKPADALKMYELYILMRDSIQNEETMNAAIKKTFQIEYERKAAADSVMVAEEKKVTSAERKQEETKKFALIAGLILVALFGVFMYNRFKVTQKQNILIQEQKSELQKQKELVEEAQKETLDSIHYAKRIQTALIANSNFIDQHIPNNFIYFNPKDIVSGDFYWAALHNDKFYLAICDSTGHGVPGAFMSLLNIGFLSEAVKEKNIEKPNEIFDYVRDRLINTISSEGQKDGMDGILLCIDKKKGTYTYAAANNEPILIRDDLVVELEKDKMPVGKGERLEKFSLHEVDLQKGDTLYLYTDGFADQFGGPKGKKFKYKQLNELLLSIKDLPAKDQKQTLAQTFETWRGNLEQVDDVLIAGIKI